jgi:diketogulonate reductase-like aldo/keto reductase
MKRSRRAFLQEIPGVGVLLAGAGWGLAGWAAGLGAAEGPPAEIHRRRIPSSGEQIAALGLGSWITFDIPPGDGQRRQTSRQVIEQFLAMGGGMIDSSPMYGYAQQLIGENLRGIPQAARAFSATKVWIPGASLGEAQMDQALGLWGLDRFDLVHVHNLVDWRVHLPWLQAWKEQGKLRYIGVTTSHGRRHEEMANIIREQPVDFVQFTYNIVDREVESNLLPMALEHGKAVVINRPFRGGDLFRQVRGKPLPPWAGELGCTTWAQFLLAWIISHPAVCCAIPATSNPQHLAENMSMLGAALPSARQRQQMLEWFQDI